MSQETSQTAPREIPPATRVALKRVRKERNMFRKKHHGPPNRAFAHAEDCKILITDPGVEISWTELESGHWHAVCVCTEQHVYEEPTANRVRLDPLDPKTSQHLGQCEYRDTTDPAVLRVILKVKDGAGGDYHWVECGACDTAWPVPHFA